MAPVVYFLGAMCSLLCAVLLLRQYGSSRHRLLLFSGLCFAGLTVANIVVYIDLAVLPDSDLHLWRWSITAASMTLLVVGLIWESKES
jgi:hypothetical protein